MRQTLSLKKQLSAIVPGIFKPRRNSVVLVFPTVLGGYQPPLHEKYQDFIWSDPEREVADDIAPRLAAKLDERPTDQIIRRESGRRWRRRCHRSWKMRRLTKYCLSTIIGPQQEAKFVQRLSYKNLKF